MASKKNVIEFEGIEFKCFSLIEYTSLIELLKLLAKKYKNLEEKMNILDGKMVEKDKRISELEVMLKGSSQSKDDKFPSITDNSKEQNQKDKEVKKQKEEEKEKEKEWEIKMNIIQEKEKKIKEGGEEEEEEGKKGEEESIEKKEGEEDREKEKEKKEKKIKIISREKKE